MIVRDRHHQNAVDRVIILGISSFGISTNKTKEYKTEKSEDTRIDRVGSDLRIFYYLCVATLFISSQTTYDNGDDDIKDEE